MTSAKAVILSMHTLLSRSLYCSIWSSWVLTQASFNFFIKARIYLLALPVAAIFILQQSSTLNSSWPIYFVTGLIASMPMYILYQTSTFFHKTYQYSKYTTQTQRFWKRASFLFWSIEGFLFAILIYLWLISPEQTSAWFNHRGELQSCGIDCYGIALSNLPLLLLLVL